MNSTRTRTSFYDAVGKRIKPPDSLSGDRGFESLRRCGAEHERMSALSFKQVIAGSAPACATKFFAPDAGGTARGLQSRYASFESGPGCHASVARRSSC